MDSALRAKLRQNVLFFSPPVLSSLVVCLFSSSLAGTHTHTRTRTHTHTHTHTQRLSQKKRNEREVERQTGRQADRQGESLTGEERERYNKGVSRGHARKDWPQNNAGLITGKRLPW